MTIDDWLHARFAASAGVPAPLVGDSAIEGDEPPVPAAVLAAIVDRAEPTLLLTQRNAAMRRHPGQIAFAGGRADPGDRDPVDTALREAWEEIALPRAAVRVIGCDATYRTISNYAIVPVLAVVPPGLPLAAREVEVADIFEVPLAHVLDPANQRRQSARFQGQERHYYEILWEDRRIWGATAAMIVNLTRRIGPGGIAS